MCSWSVKVETSPSANTYFIPSLRNILTIVRLIKKKAIILSPFMGVIEGRKTGEFFDQSKYIPSRFYGIKCSDKRGN